MADVYAELDLVWKKLCRETGVIFNFLLGQNGDTLFAGARPLCKAKASRVFAAGCASG